MQASDRLNVLPGSATRTDIDHSLHFYGLGLLAFVIAKADGVVQVEERIKLEEVIELHAEDRVLYKHFKIIQQGFDDAELAWPSLDLEALYTKGMNLLKAHKEEVNEVMLDDMVFVLNMIAKAVFTFALDNQEMRWLKRAKRDLALLLR